MDLGETLVALAVFIGLPWMIFNHINRWKQGGSLTESDEHLLDELYHTARKLDERMETVERLLGSDDPNWRAGQLPRGNKLDELHDRATAIENRMRQRERTRQ